jgi:hypothetical protein
MDETRERLIQLLQEAEGQAAYYDGDDAYGVAADYLFDNGVIVPLVKVGQTVWYLNTRYLMTMNRNTLYKAKINRIYIEKNNSIILSVLIKNDFGTIEHSGIKDIGKTVFLTREAAEEALKARENK